jgi:hypothetical protein
LSIPSVVHASVKELPAELLTVTFSFVGVAAYVLSVQLYVHVSAESCGSQSSARAAGAQKSSAPTARAETRRITRVTA